MYKALERFEEMFRQGPYLHRRSNLGNEVAALVPEDLLDLAASPKLVNAVRERTLVVGRHGSVKGKPGRRGDVMFGRIVPGTAATQVSQRAIARGLVAVGHLGVEVKILAQRQAMLKQIDRVINDLANQARTFRKHPQCMTVAIVGVNYSERYVGYEGKRTFPRQVSPDVANRESDQACQRISIENRKDYDELLILRFSASNEPPFDFEWLNKEDTQHSYASALARLSSLYEQRF